MYPLDKYKNNWAYLAQLWQKDYQRDGQTYKNKTNREHEKRLKKSVVFFQKKLILN